MLTHVAHLVEFSDRTLYCVSPRFMCLFYPISLMRSPCCLSLCVSLCIRMSVCVSPKRFKEMLKDLICCLFSMWSLSYKDDYFFPECVQNSQHDATVCSRQQPTDCMSNRQCAQVLTNKSTTSGTTLALNKFTIPPRVLII
jgi:hypothetical protein